MTADEMRSNARALQRRAAATELEEIENRLREVSGRFFDAGDNEHGTEIRCIAESLGNVRAGVLHETPEWRCPDCSAVMLEGGASAVCSAACHEKVP